MPDLHTTPGGQNPDWHSDNMTGIPQFWHFRIFQEQIVKLWKAIAARYKEEPFLLGYDLLNEPFLMPKKEGLLNAFLEEVTTAVREVDPNHIIFIEGDFFSMDFTDIRLPRDEQTALTFHFYPTVWDENLTNKDYDAAERVRKMDEQLSGFSALRDTFGRPALCGEAGVDIKKDDLSFTMQLLDETLSLFQKDVYKRQGVESSLAFTIMESVRKGKGLKPEMEEAMLAANVPDWYIWSCKKIKYMFPKAHAAAYVMMAWRIAYCKVNYPLAYYAAFFSIRASAFSYELMCQEMCIRDRPWIR